MSDKSYDYLLERAKSRLMSARSRYWEALHRQQEADADFEKAASNISETHYAEIAQLKAEIQETICLELDQAQDQLRTLAIRRAISRISGPITSFLFPSLLDYFNIVNFGII